MHGIYNYIPVTSHVSEVYNVADIQWLRVRCMWCCFMW